MAINPLMNKGRNNRFSRVWVVFRVSIGCLFVVSGFEKLIGPYQNFLYVIQSYEFLSPVLEGLAARWLPWVELLTGVFLIVGLWLKWALRAGYVFFAVFVGVVGQALVRNLPITECGCFGELISFPLPVILTMDSCLLLLMVGMMRRFDKTSRFSLDRYYLEPGSDDRQ
jgi:uncharacterized membrane protein YphA (DoxX/SURF4 family)